jgi:REP element-mobilizing transposase RayT
MRALKCRYFARSALAYELLLLPDVTAPRRVVPGSTYLVTRRCYQRTFRLRPSACTSKILAYCLAVALEKTGVVLHAACFMSNHHHLVVTDPRGELPNFLRELHRLTAKAMNAAQGQWDNLWSAEPCSAVVLADDQDIVDKIAYVAVNPVAAGLVSRPEDWPGLSMWSEGVVKTTRPQAYFREHGECPETAWLRTVAPHRVHPRASIRLIQSAIATKVMQAHRKLRVEGREFVGRSSVVTGSFIKRASSFEPKRTVIPTVAAKDPAARRALLAIQRGFRMAYREALRPWMDGVRDSVFPFGTWWMRVHHGALCAAATDTG